MGILGYGELGKVCVKCLFVNGFKVSVWFNSEKYDFEVDMYYI